MTTLTDSTPKTLSGTVDPPTLPAALLGSVVQMSSLAAVWCSYTSLGLCVAESKRFSSAASVCFSDPWARQVLATMLLCGLLWAYSLRTVPSTGTSDPSIVDRLWSILPPIYAWHFYVSAPSARGLLMAVVATVWGVRLTANFVIKGGFSGGEDYRWVEIRTWPGFRRGWELFNLLFICGFQQLVILAFTSPAAAVLGDAAAPLNGLDAVATLLCLGFVAGEALADYQMLAYQTEKYRRLRLPTPETRAEYARGFLDAGLWAYSRHPNYFCEAKPLPLPLPAPCLLQHRCPHRSPKSPSAPFPRVAGLALVVVLPL